MSLSFCFGVKFKDWGGEGTTFYTRVKEGPRVTMDPCPSWPSTPSPPADPLSQAVGLPGQPYPLQLLALAPSSRPPSLPSGIFSACPFHWYLLLCPTTARSPTLTSSFSKECGEWGGWPPQSQCAACSEGICRRGLWQHPTVNPALAQASYGGRGT